MEYKVGDEVIVDKGWFYNLQDVCIISRITPTGQIVIGSSHYRKNGWEIGGSSYIVGIATEADKERIRQKKYVMKLSNILHKTTWSNLLYDKAVKIAEILEIKIV